MHVLDTMLGKPGVGLNVMLAQDRPRLERTGRGRSDDAGRIDRLLEPGTTLKEGIYRITFETGEYFGRRKVATFYPEVQVIFDVREPDAHYHLPLILSPHGYTTYRGN